MAVLLKAWTTVKAGSQMLFFGVTAELCLLFTLSGACVSAQMLNMCGFAIFLFYLIRADDSCSPLSGVNGSRASLTPLRGVINFCTMIAPPVFARQPQYRFLPDLMKLCMIHGCSQSD